MKKIWMLVTVLALVLTLSVSVFAASVTYKDVPEGKWYTKGVQYVSEKGFMNGTGKNQFTPSGTVSRAQVAQILYAMENKPANKKYGFKDVPKGKWYTDAVNWAGAAGMMSGYEDGTFKPSEGVTRQQLATVLYKYAKYKNLDLTSAADLSSFKDSKDVASWAKTQMSWCVASKLIAGTKKGLEPKAKVTRAQLAVILMAFDQLKPVSDKPIVVDDKTPHIGENGNWWIGEKDTGVQAEGKDGATPIIGENGNWWINGKDTGVKAAAEVIETEKMKIGDKAEILPGASFSWTDANKNVIVFDSVDITMYAQDKYEEVSKDRHKSFFHSVPKDTTYSDRAYWNEEYCYHPYIFRTEIKGHTDKKLAGQIVNIDFKNIEADMYLGLIALVEKDGTFQCVHYDATYGHTYSFRNAYMRALEEYEVPELKVFDDKPASLILQYDNHENGNLKNITVSLRGKDIHGKDLSKSFKLDTEKNAIEEKSIPASGEGGYSVYVSGVLNQKGEKKIMTIQVNPGSKTREYIPEEYLTDSRKSTITIPIENKVDKAYFKNGESLWLTLRGKDINGISRWYTSDPIDETTKEVIFTGINYSDASGYDLSVDPEHMFTVAPEKKVKVNSEKTTTEKAIIQIKSFSLTVPVEASDGVLEGFKVHISGKAGDGKAIDLISVTDGSGNASFTVPYGEYNLELIEVPNRYYEWTYEPYVWVSDNTTSSTVFVYASDE